MTVAKAVDLYRIFGRIPTVASGTLFDAGSTVLAETVWTQDDLERNEKVKFIKNYTLATNLNKGSEPSFGLISFTNPVEMTDVLRKVSHSGIFTAVLRKAAPVKKCNSKDPTTSQEFIEIWNSKFGCKERTIDLKQVGKHGCVHSNEKIGDFSWSYDEKWLVYIAENKKDSVSYFEPLKKASESCGTATADEKTVGDQFIRDESFGEQLSDVKNPVICLLNINSCEISVINNISSDILPSQVIWAPDDAGLLFIGIADDPRLGLIYCDNRRSQLYYYDFASKITKAIDPTVASLDSPRFSHRTDSGEMNFAFLRRQSGGPHKKCSQLVLCNWKDRVMKTLVDVVKRPTVSDDFPGIYADCLPSNPWSMDNQRILINTCWRSTTQIIVVDVVSGKVTRVTDQDQPPSGCWKLLDLRNDILLASFSSPNKVNRLMLARLPIRGMETSIMWTSLEATNPYKDIANCLEWTIVELVPSHSHIEKFSGLRYEAILMKPRDGSVWPLVVQPHGGPHGVCLASWQAENARLCSMGYALLNVNYRGSFGFGDDNIHSLPGNVGTQDVDDVQEAVEHVLKTESRIDPKRVFVKGGSHGGFLVLHLIGQYPDFYRAGVAINPVINIASMIGTTDIPDWSICEALGQHFDPLKAVPPTALETMFQKSPIRYVEMVKSPVLFILGGDDLRVPPKHGLDYCKILKRRGIDVKILWYPENDHRIAQLDAFADAAINITRWFEEH